MMKVASLLLLASCAAVGAPTGMRVVDVRTARFALSAPYPTVVQAVGAEVTRLGYATSAITGDDAVRFRGQHETTLAVHERDGLLLVDFAFPADHGVAEDKRAAFRRALRAIACARGVGALVDVDRVPKETQPACLHPANE